MRMDQNSEQPKIVRFARFLFVWICVGIPLGLLTLTVGPMRWLANYAHKTSMPTEKEAFYGKLIILGFVVVSFLVAFLICRVILRCGKKKSQKGGMGVLLLLLVGSLGVFVFRPDLLIAKQPDRQIIVENGTSLQKAEFVLGSYPDYDQIKILKSEGYTAIITLLHPLVVPAEPKMLSDERENAQVAGIDLIEMPMLPWVSGNEKTIMKIRALAKTAKGKYYVHCYLGKGRINAFRSIIADENASYKAARDLEARDLSTKNYFENGPVFKLGNRVYITPYPSDEEFLTYLFNGDVKTIVCILNPAVASEKSLVEKEKKYAKLYGVRFVNLPIRSNSLTDIRILKDSVSKLEKPLVIHGINSNTPTVNAIKEQLKEGS